MFYKIKYYCTFLCCLQLHSLLYSQEGEETHQLIEQTDVVMEADQDLTKMIGIDHVLKLDINKISKNELMRHQFLSREQIATFFDYKNKFGKIISMYELQAIPLWDADVIRKLMKFYYANISLNTENSVLAQKEKGYQQLWMRIGRSGTGASSGYQFQRGLKETLIYRNLKYKNLYVGTSFEKDMGEKSLLDFSSFFIQKENFSVFKKIIIGDYLISMGQGMIHWHGYAFGKNANIMSILRQAQSIKPHTGTEENRFFRGAAIELEKHHHSMVLFISNKKIDANVVADSINQKKWVSSLLLSGLHRNEKEMEDKHALQVVSTGMILKETFKNGHVALNSILHHTDIPIQKRNLPYNTYSMRGNQWFNMSADFIFSLKNGTLFGEVGINKEKSIGMIVGFLKSLNRATEVGVQYRNLRPDYTSFSSNIIAHQSNAGNEKGFYIGLNMRIDSKSSIEAFIDAYHHPFPVYASDAPQRGMLSVLLFRFRPSKKVEMYARFTEKRNPENANIENTNLHMLNTQVTYQTRLHGSFQINDAIEFRIRNEVFSKRDELNKDLFGWLAYTEFILHPVLQPYSISYRSSYFNTDGYEASIYAMERDLPQYYSMNSYFNRGVSNYILLQYALTKKISFSGKWIIEKTYYNSKGASSNFETGIHTTWRTQLTIKF